MPHTAGEGYTALKTWIQDNLPEILQGDVPLDFGNPTAQRVAIDYLFHVTDINVPDEISEGFDLLFNEEEPFPRGVEPSEFAQTLKESKPSLFSKVRNFFSSAFSRLKSFFGGG
ncbi:MAG: hypothetical protein QXV17_09685 [Candidatus Micrarchaeaceae archaeon]